MKPPSTRNGACGFNRGCWTAKEGSDTVAQIRVSFPTFPHLCNASASTRPQCPVRYIRELHARKVGAVARELGDEVRVEVDAAASPRICRRKAVSASAMPRVHRNRRCVQL